MENQKKSWWSGLVSEFKKIIWPNKNELSKQTIAVVISSLVIGGLVALLDFGIKFGIEFLVSFPGK